MNKEKYLVAYILKNPNNDLTRRHPLLKQSLELQDYYITYDTLEEAEEEYENLKQWDKCYSCNNCKVIKSTDY